MIAVVAAIAISAAAGISAERRYGERASAGSRRALLFVLYFVLPPTTFLNIAAADIDVGAGVGVVLGLATLTVCALTAWLVATRVLRLSRPAVGSVIVCTLVANTGYLGYAAVASLEGFDALSEAAVYDVLVAQPALLIGGFSIGAAFGDDAGEGGRERMVAFMRRSPPLYAAILGLIAPDALAPDVAVDVARIAIVAMLPVGFFAVGTALAEESEHGAFAGIPRIDAPVALVVGLRLLAAPLILFGASSALIDIPDPYLLLVAMPCGINAMIVTHAYGLDLRVTAASVTWATTIAVTVLTAIWLL